MAGGALMQLVAYGAQDVYLSGNPSITFFQAVYKKHTNFAMETIEQTVNGTVSNNGHCSVTVGRNGDLVGEMFLELTPKVDLSNLSTNVSESYEWLAERAITDIDLSIGGQRVDRHYQKWWRLYSELFMDENKRNQYGKMTSTLGFTTAAGGRRVYLPLLFFFNRNPGLYLPLIALQYHEVKVDINLSSTFDSYLTAMTMWANYVFLDSDERKRFAQTGHEYLIEQVQHTGQDIVTAGGDKQVRLTYNHPVKELVWCFSSTALGTHNDLWDTTTPQGSCNMTVSPFPTSNAISGDLTLVNPAFVSIPFDPHLPVAPHLNVKTLGSDIQFGSGFWVEEGTSVSNVSVGPMEQFKLILNGQDRFHAQEGKYFNQVQPHCHHSGNPYPGIYSYSFALKPEDHQPTGTCNFSRIDNSVGWFRMKAGAQTSLNMFAVNYNVLRVQSGMGGLAFSN